MLDFNWTAVPPGFDERSFNQARSRITWSLFEHKLFFFLNDVKLYIVFRYSKGFGVAGMAQEEVLQFHRNKLPTVYAGDDVQPPKPECYYECQEANASQHVSCAQASLGCQEVFHLACNDSKNLCPTCEGLPTQKKECATTECTNMTASGVCKRCMQVSQVKATDGSGKEDTQVDAEVPTVAPAGQVVGDSEPTKMEIDVSAKPTKVAPGGKQVEMAIASARGGKADTVCVECDKVCGTVHSCTQCKQPCHLFCFARREGTEGYGQKGICPKCLPPAENGKKHDKKPPAASGVTQKNVKRDAQPAKAASSSPQEPKGALATTNMQKCDPPEITVPCDLRAGELHKSLRVANDLVLVKDKRPWVQDSRKRWGPHGAHEDDDYRPPDTHRLGPAPRMKASVVLFQSPRESQQQLETANFDLVFLSMLEAQKGIHCPENFPPGVYLVPIEPVTKGSKIFVNLLGHVDDGSSDRRKGPPLCVVSATTATEFKIDVPTLEVATIRQAFAPVPQCNNDGYVTQPVGTWMELLPMRDPQDGETDEFGLPIDCLEQVTRYARIEDAGAYAWGNPKLFHYQSFLKPLLSKLGLSLLGSDGTANRKGISDSIGSNTCLLVSVLTLLIYQGAFQIEDLLSQPPVMKEIQLSFLDKHLKNGDDIRNVMEAILRHLPKESKTKRITLVTHSLDEKHPYQARVSVINTYPGQESDERLLFPREPFLRTPGTGEVIVRVVHSKLHYLMAIPMAFPWPNAQAAFNALILLTKKDDSLRREAERYDVIGLRKSSPPPPQAYVDVVPMRIFFLLTIV